MNKPLRRVAIFCLVLVAALMVRTNWLQLVKADDYAENSHNKRVKIERYAHPRGDIIVGGKAITGTTRSKNGDPDFKYKRTYTNGPMYAPVTGYSSQAFGSDKLEGVEDDILAGTDDRLFFRRSLDVLTGKERQGGSVKTTIDPKVQKAGYKSFQGKKGAAVAIDPSTGALLGIISSPSYDPNKIAGSGDKSQEAWEKLNTKDGRRKSRFQNRALRTTYPPGSAFKVVTGAAGLENGLYEDADSKTKTPKHYTPPGTTTELPNEGNIPCENATLMNAMRYSCNTVFGKMGVDLGNEKLREEAEKFGFNQDDIRTPVKPTESVYPKEMDKPGTAQSAIGQRDTRASPLQMAMVASAVANNGKLMQPYTVDKLQSSNLSVIEQHDPKEYSQPMSPDNASEMQRMMETVVEDGTGTNAQIPGITVGGKTGTAQHGVANSENPYAWFISYAKKDDNAKVAVAVVVEDPKANRDDISGGGLAAPIAKNMMEAAVNK